MIRWEAVIIAIFGALARHRRSGSLFGWALQQALRDRGRHRARRSRSVSSSSTWCSRGSPACSRRSGPRGGPRSSTCSRRSRTSSTGGARRGRYHGRACRRLTLPDGRARRAPRGGAGRRRAAPGDDRRARRRRAARPVVRARGRRRRRADRPARSDDGLHVLRHSTAHVLAQAVCDLYPGARYAIGPAIEDGFYYDFELPEPVQPADLARIDGRMRADREAEPAVRPRGGLARRGARAPRATSRSSVEIIEGLEAEEAAAGEATVGRHGQPVPQRRVGGPVPGPARAVDRAARRVQADEASRAPTGAATRRARCSRGSTAPRGRPRTTSTPTCSALEEAERRDHRKLGAELDLFSFPEEIGSGLAVFHPQGGLIRRLMEDYSRDRHEEARLRVRRTRRTSRSRSCSRRAGTSMWFADGMFPPMELDGGSRVLPEADELPVPHPDLPEPRRASYRELPMRLFEFGTVYRYEKSGVCTGSRASAASRRTTPTSSPRRSRWARSSRSLLDFVLDLLRDYGLDDFYLELSTQPEGKAVGTDEEWDEAHRGAARGRRDDGSRRS